MAEQNAFLMVDPDAADCDGIIIAQLDCFKTSCLSGRFFGDGVCFQARKQLEYVI